MEIVKGQKLRVINGGPKGGDIVRCPACGCGLPLVQVGDALVPCQPALVVGAEPIRSLVDHSGRPLPIADLGAFVRENAFRPVQVMIPHAAVCDAGAWDVHGRPAPLHTAIQPPPPDCHTCGHPWAAHRKVTQTGAEDCRCRAEIAAPEPGHEGASLRCACETWVVPPGADEAAVEVAS